MVAEGFTSSFPMPTNQEHLGTLGVFWALAHHVITHRLQGFRLMEIDQTFRPRFRTHAFGVIGAKANDDPFASVLEIFELKIKDFARS